MSTVIIAFPEGRSIKKSIQNKNNAYNSFFQYPNLISIVNCDFKLDMSKNKNISEKINSANVPQKLCEWVVAMGCPPEIVPSVEKVEKVGGVHNSMIWRSLMEHVRPKAEIRYKRLQVFLDDVNKCKKKNESGKETVVPEELQVWKEHQSIKEKVIETEARVIQARQNLKLLMNKNSSKFCQREQSRRSLQDLQRRVWFLQQVRDELHTKKGNLQETKSIADSLCTITDDPGVTISKFDKCLSLVSYQSKKHSTFDGSISTLSGVNPVASSSVVSTGGAGDGFDAEEQLSSLMRCDSDAFWSQLNERRARLISDLTAANNNTIDNDTNNRVSPQTILSHTMALQCTLGLEAQKNLINTKRAYNKLVEVTEELNSFLSGEACELLVVLSEEAYVKARVATKLALLDDVTSRAGDFALHEPNENEHATVQQIHMIDKDIESKKVELINLLNSMSFTERKINNVRDCLVAVFSSFHDDNVDIEKYRGLQLDIPQDSISMLRQFYDERQEMRKKNKLELSIDLDISEKSLNGTLDTDHVRFTEELRIYLNKFNLEKNRKLVLESGEKIWIFENLNSSLDYLYKQWQDADISCTLLCPFVCLSKNLRALYSDVVMRETLMERLMKLNGTDQSNIRVDITEDSEEERKILDKIKKQLNEGLLSLHKTDKMLEVVDENLKLWKENLFKNYISSRRTKSGMCFRDYEAWYIKNS